MKTNVSIDQNAKSGVHKQVKDIHISLYNHKDPLTRLYLNNHYEAFVDQAKNEVRKSLDKINETSDKDRQKEIVSIYVTAEHRAILHAHQILSGTRLQADIHHAKEVEALRAALTLIQSKAVISGDVAIVQIATSALSEATISNHSSAELQKMLDTWKEANFTK